MPLFDLGLLADQAAEQKNGPVVSYAINRHINYTNTCQMGCCFCGFSRVPGHSGAYTLALDEIIKIADRACQLGADELHIVGGINPQVPYSYYFDLIRLIRQHCQTIHIKAYTAVEISHIAAIAERSVESVLADLIDAGLNSLPGGGAEILDDDFHQKSCPKKASPQQWLDVHKTAHRLGLNTNATMLYSFGESQNQRLTHLNRLKNLQQESLNQGRGRFQCFVPLPYVPNDSKPDSGIRDVELDLRIIATSRLILSNFDHIKAFWPLMGKQTAQIALRFGADDLDGTVGEYRIASPQPTEKNGLTESEIRLCITQAGKTPLRRAGGYKTS